MSWLRRRRVRRLCAVIAGAAVCLAGGVALVPQSASLAAGRSSCHQRAHHHCGHHGSTASARPTSTTSPPSSTTRPTTTTVAPTTTTMSSSPGSIPSPLYGITLDNDADISTAALNAQVAALTALPHKPTVRIVLDAGSSPADYTRAIAALNSVSYLMAELVDSSDVKNTSATAYHSKTATFLAAFPQIPIWEVGNEVNGNWLGAYSDVAAKVIDAFDLVHSSGHLAALTLWENSWAPDHCGDGTSELTAQQFSSQYLPEAMRVDVDYALVSWYPTQCTGLANVDVPAATIAGEMQSLAALYPNAHVGFGEVGLPNAVTSSTLATAQNIAGYYYRLQLAAPYAGGGFWWYGAEDAVPSGKPMWATLNGAMQ